MQPNYSVCIRITCRLWVKSRTAVMFRKHARVIYMMMTHGGCRTDTKTNPGEYRLCMRHFTANKLVRNIKIFSKKSISQRNT